MKIILASKSPRRIELLNLIFENFSVEPAQGEEIIPKNSTPQETVISLAKAKAEEIAKKNPNDLVIGADTIVTIDGEILGKPKNKEHCIEMLKKLSGRKHSVLTGVALVKSGKIETFFEQTEVEFYTLSDEEIAWYSSLEEPYDKAGSYGIQGKGSLLVKGIVGDYYNVMGLPIAALNRRCKDFLK